MNWTDLFRFSPRASRQEYAFVSLCTQGISLLFYALQGRLAPEGLSWIQFILALAFGFVSAVLLLAVFWVGLAVSFRRMHDMNLSGLWYVGYYVAVVCVGVVFSEIWWVATVLGVAAMLFLCLKKPSSSNRFAAAAPAFMPGVFSKRGVFAAAVAACILLSVGQVALSRWQLASAQQSFPARQIQSVPAR